MAKKKIVYVIIGIFVAVIGSIFVERDVSAATIGRHNISESKVTEWGFDGDTLPTPAANIYVGKSYYFNWQATVTNIQTIELFLKTPIGTTYNCISTESAGTGSYMCKSYKNYTFSQVGEYSYYYRYTYSDGSTYSGNTNVVKANLYELSYNANGGSGAPSSQTKAYGKTLTLSNKKPTKSGYTFMGWSTSSIATSATYQPGDSYTANSDVTLYAVWKANTYTVSYNVNGGSGAPLSQTKTYGKTLTLSSTKPTRTGYIFKGWSTSSTSTNVAYQPGESYTSNSGITLYAVWEANTYTVSYNANGGSGAPLSQTKTYGKTLTLSSTKPTRTGYIFKGWSTSSTSTNATYQSGGSYTSNSGTTLYAVWQKIDDHIGDSDSGNNGSINTDQNNTDRNNSGSSLNSIDIKKRNQIISAKSLTVSKGTKPFYLSVKTNGDGTITYKSSNNKIVIISSTGKVVVKDYGTVTVTIKAAETSSYFGATKTITIKVVPKKVGLKKVSSIGKKRLSVSWKKDKTVAGYQVQFCTRKDFKQGTYQRMFNKSKTKMGIYGLKSGKVFYVRIRGFKKVGKKKYYGAWSKVKKVKIK